MQKIEADELETTLLELSEDGNSFAVTLPDEGLNTSSTIVVGAGIELSVFGGHLNSSSQHRIFQLEDGASLRLVNTTLAHGIAPEGGSGGAIMGGKNVKITVCE
ncbi:unnamed protein product [Chrysoparadoxa australica]